MKRKLEQLTISSKEEPDDQVISDSKNDPPSIANKKPRGLLLVNGKPPLLKLPRPVSVRVGSGRGRGNKQLDIHTYIRYYDAGNITATTSDTFGAAYFALSALPGVAEFTALYDQYRIDKITAIFLPQQTNAPVASTGATTPVLLVAADYDDATAWTVMTQPLQYENLKFHEFNKRVDFTFIPRMAVAAYSGTFGSFANVDPQWIDSASTNVQFYALKWGTNAVSSGNVAGWRVYYKYYLSFRNII